MKLKVFNQTNALAQRAGTKPTINFGKSGAIKLNKFLVENLKLEPGHLLEIAQDEDEEDDWYFKVSKKGEGFVLRSNKDGSLTCNSSVTSQNLRDHFGYQDKGLTLDPAPAAEEGGWYALLTAKLKS